MRLAFAAVVTCSVGMGCTAHRLERSFVAQADTLSDLQYKQVLSNLAMMDTNPWLLPSQVEIRDGSSQVQDLGSASSLFDVRVGTTSHPYVSGSRTIVDQWGMHPVVNDVELKILRMAYQRAAGLDVRLQYDPDLTNDLAHELKKQIEQPENPDVRLENYYINEALGVPNTDATASNPSPGDRPTLLQFSIINSDGRNGDNKNVDKRILEYDRRIEEAKKVIDTIDGGLLDVSSFISKIEKNQVPADGIKGSRPVINWKVELEIPDKPDAKDEKLVDKVRRYLEVLKSKIKKDLIDLQTEHDALVYEKKSSRKLFIDYETSIRQAEEIIQTIDQGLSDVSSFIKRIDANEVPTDRIRKLKREIDWRAELNIPNPLGAIDRELVELVRRNLETLRAEIETNALNRFRGDLAPVKNDLRHTAIADADLKLMVAKVASDRFNKKVLTGSEEELIRKEEFSMPFEFLEPGRLASEPDRRVSPTVKEVRRQVKKVEDDLLKIPAGWYCVGGKPPKDAYVVGRHGRCYAWVEARNLRQLADFTLIVQNISDLIKDVSVVTEPGGPKYSPTPAVGPAGRF